MSTEISPSPEFVPHVPPARRQIWVWYVLAILFIAMSGSAVQETFTRSEEPDGAALGQSALQLELSIYQSGLTKTSTAVREQLEDSVKKFGETAPNDPESAIGLAVAKRELGVTITEDDLAVLATEPDLSYQAARYFYLYAPEGDSAKQLADTIGTSSKLSTLARMQALEASGDESVRSRTLQPKMLLLSGLGLGIVGAAILGTVLWGLYAGNRKTRYPPGFALELPTRLDADRAACRAVLMLMAFLVAPMVVRGSGIFGIVLFLVVLAGGLLVPIFGKTDRLGAIIGRRGPIAKLLGEGIKAELMAVPILVVSLIFVAALQRFLPDGSHPSGEELLRDPSIATILSFFIQAVVMAPIIEEVIFRGLLAPAIARVSSPLVGILTSGFLFAAIHPQGLAGWLPLAVFGCMAAFVTFQTKSLIPSMFMHAIHNGGIMAFTILLAR